MSFPVISSPKSSFATRVALFHRHAWCSHKKFGRERAIFPIKLPHLNFTFTSFTLISLVLNNRYYSLENTAPQYLRKPGDKNISSKVYFISHPVTGFEIFRSVHIRKPLQTFQYQGNTLSPPQTPFVSICRFKLYRNFACEM